MCVCGGRGEVKDSIVHELIGVVQQTDDQDRVFDGCFENYLLTRGARAYDHIMAKVCHAIHTS